MEMAVKFKLYSSEGCHLCEQALALCSPYIPASDITIIDIVEDEKLVELYGVHIPVLERCVDNKKLYWPFSAVQISELNN